jgi:hypothetical protein
MPMMIANAKRMATSASFILFTRSIEVQSETH